MYRASALLAAKAIFLNVHFFCVNFLMISTVPNLSSKYLTRAGCERLG